MPEDNITNGGIFLPTGWHQTTFDLSKLRDGFFEWRDVLLVGLLTWLEFHKRASTWVHFKSAPLGTKKQKPSSQFTSTCVSLSQTCHNWDLLWLQNSNLKNQQIWHKLSQEVRNTHTLEMLLFLPHLRRSLPDQYLLMFPVVHVWKGACKHIKIIAHLINKQLPSTAANVHLHYRQLTLRLCG